MKFAAIVLLAVSVSLQARACSLGEGDKLRQNTRFYPIVENTNNHWPSEFGTLIGSITSFLVPLDAKVELQSGQPGRMATLTIFGQPSHEQMRSSPNLVPRWVDISYDAKKFRWVHIYASSYGSSEVRMSAAKGWSKTMKITVNYPSPTEVAMRSPVALVIDRQEATQELPVVDVDGRDNIEITVAGAVADGWTVTPVEQTGFELIRVQQVQQTAGEPQVRLFFSGTSNPKASTMVIMRGGSAAKESTRLQFRINARPTITC